MDFNLTSEQRLIQKAAKEFREVELEPIAAKVDTEKKVPPDISKKFGKAGFLGMIVPRKYGGSEAGYVSYALAVEQIHYAAQFAFTCFMLIPNSVGAAIAQFGTEEQKERYIRPMCQGDTVPSWSFTEPATGSDPRSLVTRAELVGDHWVVNGVKRFNTLGHLPGPALIWANVEGNKTTAFIVEKNCQGYSTSKPIGLMTSPAVETVDTYLKDVRIPKDNLLGEVGRGFDIMVRVFAGVRVAIAAKSVALAQAALDEAVKYAKQRTRRGVPIASMQAIQWMLAEMASRVEAARWMTYWCAFLKDQGHDVSKESAMAKLLTSRLAVEVADMGMQIHGAYGCTTDYKIERIYRAAKEGEITEGSSEVQRSIIAHYLISS